MWKRRTLVIVFCFLFQVSCGRSLDVELSETGAKTVSYDETIHMNNCGGKAASEQTATRSFATSLEGTFSIGGNGPGSIRGIPIEVEAGLEAKYGHAEGTSKAIKLIAPAGTDMEFNLEWIEEAHAGKVTYEKQNGQYTVRIPISVNLLSSQDLGCDITEIESKPSPTPIVDNILFHEDFEDGLAQGISNVSGNWAVISDDDGNKVYEANNIQSTKLAGFDFGSNAWKNYQIEYKVKMLNLIKEAPEVTLGFRSDFDSSSGYVQYFTPYYNTLGLDEQKDGTGWLGMTARQYSFKSGDWYRVRIIANGSRLQIYLDDKLYIDTTNSDFTSGPLIFLVAPGAHVLLDNISVTEIN